MSLVSRNALLRIRPSGQSSLKGRKIFSTGAVVAALGTMRICLFEGVHVDAPATDMDAVRCERFIDSLSVPKLSTNKG